MIEYLENEHIYLYNGIIIPSVSKILNYIFPDKYKNIPADILQNKAHYGTKLHELVQITDQEQITDYDTLKLKIEHITFLQENSIKEYLKLKKEHNIEIVNQEQIVCYKGLYAGRFDKDGFVNKKSALIDLKTTAELDKEYLSWQLSYYELANGKKYNKLYAMWLPKGKQGELVEIKRKTKKELLDMLNKFLEEEEKNAI